MLTIDGSILEGGGQLTRMALCLSALTSTPIKICNIRAGRGSRPFRPSQGDSKQRSSQNAKKRDKDNSRTSNAFASEAKMDGGLKESHLAALYWLAECSYADVDGDQVGSREVVFKPSKRSWAQQPAQIPTMTTIELKNPGSIWLIFQAIFPFMIFSDESKLNSTDTSDSSIPIHDITLKGGTNVPKSMSTEYVQQVFLPLCEKIGLPRTEIETIKRGWTTGKLEVGQVRMKVYPPQPRPRSTSHSSKTDLGAGLDSKKAATAVTKISQTISSTEKSPAVPNEAQLTTLPFILPSFAITSRGTITSISMTLLTSSPETQLKLSNLLTSTFQSHPTYHTINPQPTISIHPSSSTNTSDPRRLYILLVAHTSNNWVLGRDYLGPGSLAKNSKQEDLLLQKAAVSAVTDLMGEINAGGCVDEYMADQLVVFQALAEGTSVVDSGRGGKRDIHEGEDQGDQAGSLHTRTVRWVCEEILGKYGVKFGSGGRCDGIGWNGKSCKVKEVDDWLGELDVEDERV